jgi:hypothetical protein
MGNLAMLLRQRRLSGRLALLKRRMWMKRFGLGRHLDLFVERWIA